MEACIGVPAILSIAGSDPSGGAGIQGDLKTITRLGGYGMAVVTGLTAQSTMGVAASTAVDSAFVRQQLEVLWEDSPPAAAKTGMLATRDIVLEVSRFLAIHSLPVVVDPVMVSTSGSRLLAEDAVEAIRRDLLPVATLVTPNVPEAEVLTGRSIRTLREAQKAAEDLLAMGARAVLIKGGDMYYNDEPTVEDVFLEGGQVPMIWRSPRHSAGSHASFHGSGCCLAAATATALGFGLGLTVAVQAGRTAVQEAILSARPIGKGAVPVNHFGIRPLKVD
jgi:hydroxymethylpyrimidine/phosphomethylpyrimidine kinase